MPAREPLGLSLRIPQATAGANDIPRIMANSFMADETAGAKITPFAAILQRK